MGITPGGPFEIPEALAHEMLKQPNPHGKSNEDVLRSWVNGRDITRRLRGRWILDFGVDMPEGDGALYEAPFEYVVANVKPQRLRLDQDGNFAVKRGAYRAKWWLHMEPRPAMRDAIAPLGRYLATSMVGKHRYFVWLGTNVLPANLVIAIALDNDYTFAVLHSRVHELWARGMGTQLREVESGFRYTPTTTFETFPFPWPPGQEPGDDPRVEAIGETACKLNQLREAWLNPPGASEEELKMRTLTNLYNTRPTWLAQAHDRLDRAVLDAYGWQRDISDEEILARLLVLNLARERA